MPCLLNAQRLRLEGHAHGVIPLPHRQPDRFYCKALVGRLDGLLQVGLGEREAVSGQIKRRSLPLKPVAYASICGGQAGQSNDIGNTQLHYLVAPEADMTFSTSAVAFFSLPLAEECVFNILNARAIVTAPSFQRRTASDKGSPREKIAGLGIAFRCVIC